MGELPGILGLSCPIKLKLLDLLASQLDHKHMSHNMTMAGLQKRVNGVFQKSGELLYASTLLIEEKVELEEKLLS